MKQALRPGAFIKYGVSYEFVRGLEPVAQGLDSLVLTEQGSAAKLYEIFIGACHEKAEEIDDSGGNLAMFVQQLFVDWVRARQAAKHDATDTIRRLVAWVERGLALAQEERFGGSAEYDLKKQHRILLQRLGRVAEAVASAWADFDKYPGVISYRILLKLAPADEQHTLRSRALARGESADLGSMIALLSKPARWSASLDVCHGHPMPNWKGSAISRRSQPQKLSARLMRHSPPACTAR